MMRIVRELLGVVHSWTHPNCKPIPAQPTVGDIDDLTAVATAVGVLVDTTPIDYTPTGFQPACEFTAEPVHPSQRGWLNDMALAGFVAYCEGEAAS